MKKLGEIFETSLTEGYEDRVAEIGSRVIDSARGNGRVDDVDHLIHLHARGSLEHRLGGRAYADLVADVRRRVKGQVGQINRVHSRQKKSESLKAFHNEVANHIDTAIGNAYPDIDPFDEVARATRRSATRHGIRLDDYDISHHLDAGARLNGYRDYHHQVASVWESITGDHDPLGENPFGHPDVEDVKSRLRKLSASSPTDHHGRSLDPDVREAQMKLRELRDKHYR